MKSKSILVIGIAAMALLSCKKNKCAECHYDVVGGSKVEIGKYCGDDLENIEKTGFSVDGTMREVHCGEH